MADDAPQNYYQILEVPVNANAEEIRLAYEFASETYKRDSLAIYSLFSFEESDAILRKIRKAYFILSDPVSREQYNQTMGLTHVITKKQVSSPPKTLNSERPNPSPVKKVSALKENSATLTASSALKSRIDDRSCNRNSISKKNQETKERVNQFIQGISQFTGTILQQIREMKAIGLEELSKETCVRKVFLAAIEAEDFSQLPSGEIYWKNFISNYARCLELPVDRVLRDYLVIYHNQNA